MRAPKQLAVSVIALALASCTAYVHHDGRRARHPYDGGHPCRHDGRNGVIGLSIGRPGGATRGPIAVLDVTPTSPAADARIEPGDRIRAIDGEATRGMTVAEAARLIRGRPGSAVELRVESPRGARLITLVRVPYSHGHRHGSCRRCAHHRGREHWRKQPCDGPGAAYRKPPPASPPVADDALAPDEQPSAEPGPPR